MSNKNLTKTLFADFRKVDTKKLNIDGNPFSKVVTDHVPETPTAKDIWKYAVTTDDNGVVTITDDVSYDYTEITTAQKNITKTAAKVIDNKVLDANGQLLMNWDTKNFTNENGKMMLSIFNGFPTKLAPITEWNSDLSNLTDGYGMFAATALTSFNGDLSSLTNGNGMFGGGVTTTTRTPLTSWNIDLPNLTNGTNMFYNTNLESFNGDLPNLTNGYQMFFKSDITSFSGDLSSLTDCYQMFLRTALKSFSGDLSSLTDATDMFAYTALASFNGDLSSLVDGYRMFYQTALQSFSGDLSSLVDGYRMFYQTALTSFNGDLSSLTDGYYMFHGTALQSFNGNLSSLTDGSGMFCGTALTSWDIDLPSLTKGLSMFYNTALQSFNGDLSSLTNGTNMFSNNQSRRYNIQHYKIVDGTKTSVKETFVSNGLKSFISNLSSLKCGYEMFGDGDDVDCTYTDDSGTSVTETTKDVAPLDEESIMIIADTINDISSLDKTVDSDWTYTSCDSDGNLTTETISSEYRGVLHLGYASSITDTTNIFNYCDQIVAKGWTVYLNGSQYTSTNSGSAALIDGESSTTPIPHYYKPVQVTDEEIAEYVDANNNYYIIVGGQHVFGDDISTYGMFTSYQHAVQEITTSLGLTKYEKPSTETTNN